MLVHVTTKYEDYDGFCSTTKDVTRIFENANSVDFDVRNYVVHVHNLDEDGIDHEYVEEFTNNSDIYVGTSKLRYTTRMIVGDNDFTYVEDGFFLTSDCINDKDFEEIFDFDNEVYCGQVIHFVEELNPDFDMDAWVGL